MRLCCEPARGRITKPAAIDPAIEPMVLATVTFPTSAPTLLALAIDRMTSGKVVPMQVTGMASAPNAARARTDSRPGQLTTRSPRLAKRSGILSQMGSDAASAIAATARLNASASFLAKRAIRLASGVPAARHTKKIASMRPKA